MLPMYMHNTYTSKPGGGLAVGCYIVIAITDTGMLLSALTEPLTLSYVFLLRHLLIVNRCTEKYLTI